MASVLITGTSKGIGFETALAFARAGHTVFATMRSPSASPELGQIAAREHLAIHIYAMDVDFDSSVTVDANSQNLTIDVDVSSWFKDASGAIIDPTRADSGRSPTPA